MQNDRDSGRALQGGPKLVPQNPLEHQAVAEKTACRIDSRKWDGVRVGHAGGGDLSNNVLMDLRKAAAHPALVRMILARVCCTDMAKACKKEAQWKDSNEKYVVEDFGIMPDSQDG
ncbi:hypothetical protein BKA62DRAFT_454890 [Auriculariales sp. MPI-PUGE-AT-0066]|nr:hypothetical protein BKA62DRAFT_454890 [Auriculariales sp. MPI-PUGE-AT-0066]